ncbi:MAG TPA: SBBP repeat-containing protein [Bryobacteraceae bacterium]|nr:SBBP repeat-containing protein [Bryobacteraceae bacterium]
MYPAVFRCAALLVFSFATARAQQSTLSNVSFNPRCIAPDGHGNNFVVGSDSQSGIDVANVDSGGNVIATSSFRIASDATPAAAAVDPQGNLWIVGAAIFGTATNEPLVGMIAEVDSSGTKLLMANPFGGVDPKGYTRINTIAIDTNGNLYVGGYSFQSDFPLTAGAFMSQYGNTSPPAGCSWDGPPTYGFIAKLAQSTQKPYTLTYSTLLGSQQVPAGPCGFPPSTAVSALAVDANGVVTAAGTTEASNFPVTPGSYQSQYAGQTNDVDIFVTRLNAQGSALVWSTLLATAPTIASDNILLSGIALDSDSGGNVVLTGTTDAASIPVTAGALQPKFANPQGFQLGPINGFVAKVNATGSNLIFSTYYGIDDGLSAPRLDAQGNIWITGSVADQSGLVLHPNSLNLGGSLIAELAPDGSSVLFSELLSNGVAGQDLALNPDGSLLAVGTSANTVLNASTGFVLRLPRGAPSGISILSVADSAVNEVTGTVAPGEFLSIYGTGLGTTSEVGTQVSVDGILTPMLYASANQINVLAPYEIQAGKQVNIRLTTDAGSAQTGPLQVVPAQPGMFVVLNADGSVNSASHPAAPESVISIFVSGAGALSQALPDGTIAGSPAPVPALPVLVDISYTLPSTLVPILGVETVTPDYAGGVPGTVIDMLRVAVKLPAVLDTAWGSSVAVQVGDAKSATTPLYVSTSP